ncbi:MAG: TolC family protein, partial [Bacteroidota bacterium]
EGAIAIETRLKQELDVLLRTRFAPEYETVYPDYSAPVAPQLAAIYASNTDLVIAVGFQAGTLITSSDQELSKPTILSFLVDNALQGVPPPDSGTSGVKNLNYVQSPFDLRRDFTTLYAIKPFKKIGILVSQLNQQSNFDLDAYLQQLLAFTEADYETYVLNDSAGDVLNAVSDDVDAVFLFPILEPSKRDVLQETLTGLTDKGLPTFSMFSDPALELGAYAAYETEDNFARIPRRVALNAMKILEGAAPETLPVVMDNYTEDLLINMQVARASRHYPSWDVMSEAVLLNLSVVDNTERQLTLNSAIAEGLNNSLGLVIAEKDVQISAEDVRIARSNYLPQMEVTGTALALDQNTVAQSFGTRGSYNLQAVASLTQLLLSEPAMANIAIQKLLLESQSEVLRQSQLDVVQDVAEAYLGILQATAVVRLRNENVAVTRKNYNIAQTKATVGTVGTNDVYRFESELAFDNVDLNNAQAQWRQARFALNNLLNRPIKEEFALADAAVSDSILLVTDPRLFSLISNPGDVDLFADFLVEEAFKNAPELQQLSLAKAAQERSLLSQKRAFYLPTVAFSAEYTLPIEQFQVPESMFGAQITSTWNAAVAVQLPIFQGNGRRNQLDQTRVGVFQLADQIANLRNNLELQVRANMETAGASFSNLDLSRKAVEASRKNFGIAQNNYQQGLLNITSLIDAQNALLQAEINAINAEYTFINDFLAVERSIGYFHFLAPPQEQDAFLQRFVQFTRNEK